MTITVEALVFDAVIGILDFEREAPQRVRIDAVIDYDYKEGRFIDYAEVVSRIKTVVCEHRFGLLEDALAHLKHDLKAHFPLMRTLRLDITKPDILPDCTVSLGETYKF